jgi:hypothetical protein
MLEIINSSRSEILSDWDAKFAWNNFIAKFEPRAKSSLIQLKKQFLKNKQRDSNQDLDQWIQSLEGMQRKLQIFGHKISEMDMIIHILQNLTKEYDTTAEILENDLDNDLASLDRVKEKLRARFEKIQKTRPNEDGVLIVKDIRPGKYEGLCSFCGMCGHKTAQCRTKLIGMNEKQEGEKEKNVNDKKLKSFLSRVLYANKRVTKHMNAQETREIRREMMKLILHQNQLTLS